MPLSLEHISKSYGAERIVLKSVDMLVEDGESVAIMGPSGSGKTTLLSIIGLLADPTSGSLMIDGVPPPRRHANRHSIRSRTFGWVLQTVNVSSKRSAVDNVAVPLLASGHSRQEALAMSLDALEKVGLKGRAYEPVNVLSGGESQRVCIARALAHRPRFLLADEPTGQLDNATSLEVLDAMLRLRSDTGSTLLVATHDATVAATCDRAIDLIDGMARER